MPRVGLDAETITRAAADLADADGLSELTLARLAARLGVRSPSLYAHVDGLGDLRSRIAIQAARELTATVQAAAAGRAGGDALRAVADAYLAYARAHPGGYAAIQRAPGGGEGRASADLTAAATTLVDVFVAVVRGYSLTGDDAIHAVRIIRAALHGFVALEHEGGFAMPVALEQTYDRLVAVLDHGLAALPAGGGP